MKHYQVTLTVVIQEDNPDAALKKLREKLRPWGEIVHNTNPVQVEQVWQKVHDGRGPG